ncbi:unnamed protein product, partial [Scytosiphon promiscuus]
MCLSEENGRIVILRFRCQGVSSALLTRSILYLDLHPRSQRRRRTSLSSCNGTGDLCSRHIFCPMSCSGTLQASPQKNGTIVLTHRLVLSSSCTSYVLHVC